jgi:superfamily II DNA or RNA helicase
MKIIVDSQAHIHDVPGSLATDIKRTLTLDNPAYVTAKKQGRYSGHLDEKLYFFEDDFDVLSTPRGFCRELLQLCKAHSIKPEFVDKRREVHPVDIRFNGALRGYQKHALKDILSCDFGIVESATGSGKTVLGLAAISARNQSTLVVVHSLQLLEQWRERAEEFLNIVDEIGILGGGHSTIGTELTIGTIKTVCKHWEELKQKMNHIVIDEVHRGGAASYTEFLSKMNCRYQLGLSATPVRSDGLSKVVQWYVGPIVHKVNPRTLEKQGHILKPEIVWRETDFGTRLDPTEQYAHVLNEIADDSKRNALIADDVKKEAGGVSLLLSERKNHCHELAKIIGEDAVVITGSTPTKKRGKLMESVKSGKSNIMIATTSLVGEGMDISNLANLFLCCPIKWKGRTIQVAGRILRPQDGKRPKIYDYIDSKVGVFQAQAKARLKTYREQGWC